MRLTPEKCESIRALRARGDFMHEIAEVTGVSQSTVWKVIHNRHIAKPDAKKGGHTCGFRRAPRESLAPKPVIGPRPSPYISWVPDLKHLTAGRAPRVKMA